MFSTHTSLSESATVMMMINAAMMFAILPCFVTAEKAAHAAMPNIPDDSSAHFMLVTVSNTVPTLAKRNDLAEDWEMALERDGIKVHRTLHFHDHLFEIEDTTQVKRALDFLLSQKGCEQVSIGGQVYPGHIGPAPRHNTVIHSKPPPQRAGEASSKSQMKQQKRSLHEEL